MEEKNELYPVEYNFIMWDEEECDSVFVNCYHSKDDLNYDGGVYVAEGIWVYPDGRLEKW